MSTMTLPPPEIIRQRMALCREELAALRKALRLSLAIRQAEEARRRRGAAAQPGQEVPRTS
jgi:hypothetical protein